MADHPSDAGTERPQVKHPNDQHRQQDDSTELTVAAFLAAFALLIIGVVVFSILMAFVVEWLGGRTVLTA